MYSARAIDFYSVYSGWAGGFKLRVLRVGGRGFGYLPRTRWACSVYRVGGGQAEHEGTDKEGGREGGERHARRCWQQHPTAALMVAASAEHGRSHDRPTDRRRTARPRARRDVSANVNGANRLHHPKREGGRESAKCPPHHFFSKFICRKNAISAYTMRTRWACTVYRVGGWDSEHEGTNKEGEKEGGERHARS